MVGNFSVPNVDVESSPLLQYPAPFIQPRNRNCHFEHEVSTKFLYDDDGNLTRRTDPNSIARNWTYNALGFATVMTDELGAYEQRTYTFDGLPLTITNRDGSMISMDYDAMGKQTYKELQPSLHDGGSYDEITTEYDGLGPDTLIENTNSRILRTYRPEGTLWTEEQYLKFSEAAGKTFKYEYTYNQGGARTKMKMLIDGVLQREVDYGRGEDNLLTSLTWAGKSLYIAHDDLGRRQSLNFPLGVSTAFTYDADGRLDRMIGSGIDHDFTSYDGFGRPLALTRTDHSGTTNSTWNYDLQGQITYEATTGSTATYVYDKAGNRTRETLSGVSYLHSYIPNTNRLEKRCAANTSWLCISGGAYDQYSYNENGDMTRKQTHTGLDIPYFRTATGQITSLYLPPTVHYRYDGLGRMVMRRDGQSLNQITGYDGHNVAWHNGSFFLHGDGVDDPLVLSLATSCYYVTAGGRMLGYLTESGVIARQTGRKGASLQVRSRTATGSH
jgi:YD repeat-containing protein